MITPEQIEQATTKHGRVKLVQYNGHEMLFRKPSRPECKDYARKMNDDATKNDADEQLALMLVVNFDGADDQLGARRGLIQLFDDYPLAANSKAIGGAISRLAGVVQDEDAKKPESALAPSVSSPANSPRV